MSIALVPRHPGARPARPHALTPFLSLGIAGAMTVLMASAVAALVPNAPAPAEVRSVAPATTAGVAGPVRVLPAIQVVAQR